MRQSNAKKAVPDGIYPEGDICVLTMVEMYEKGNK